MDRAQDARFLLPAPPEDVVFADHPDALDTALRSRPSSVVVQGRAVRELRRAGWWAGSVVALPDLTDPAVLIPVGDARVARYALALRPPRERSKRVRNRTLAWLLGRRAPSALPQLTLASPVARPPFLVAEAARETGIVPGACLLTPGESDVLSRGAIHVFNDGAAWPSWVVKFHRVAGYSAGTDGDERGLRIAARAGGRVAAHAPRMLGRFVAAGHHASVETAARGARMNAHLLAHGSATERMASVEAVADWTLDVALETAHEPEAAAPRLEDLVRDVLPLWPSAPPDLVERLPPLPAVLEHSDLGTWNIVVGKGGFTVLDWESAREHSLPLWDLWYFLTDALAHFEGHVGPEARPDHFSRLFAGRSPTSPVLFAHTRRFVERLGIAPEAVGPLATLCVLAKASAHHTRADALSRVAPDAVAAEPLWAPLARRWLADPALGPGWSAWR
jgi:hypothetical protein